MNNRVERMRERLQRAFDAPQLTIEDESHRHVGHAGASDGRGHYRLRIVAAEFDGLPLVKRHQRVYAALGDLMSTDIHALALDARAPSEA